MVKQILLVLFFLASGSLSAILEQAHFEDWTEGLLANGPKESQVATFHFYFHDTLSGKKPSAVPVAKAADTNRSPTRFGLVVMADDPLTEGPDPNSKLVGRAQGLYGLDSHKEFGLIMALGISFTDEKYHGSSLSIVGQNPIVNPVRELPIVGGTGLFRLARGVARLKTYSFNVTSGDAVVEYNVTVVH